ncbi:MAG: hypothetical protein KME21_04485 [Desmonostoc vinosum HA7617-LM4]|nr:hypothetical protein [Desmonostoc vinosum HA7617-LM4]
MGSREWGVGSGGLGIVICHWLFSASPRPRVPVSPSSPSSPPSPSSPRQHLTADEITKLPDTLH